ncbi:MAG: hypothetical protein N2F24_08650, partial [Deltaproteobacteria bacterium]
MPQNTFKLKPMSRAGRVACSLPLQTATAIQLCVHAFLILALLTLPPSGVWAEDLNQALNDPDMPWHIVADDLSYDD